MSDRTSESQARTEPRGAGAHGQHTPAPRALRLPQGGGTCAQSCVGPGKLWGAAEVAAARYQGPRQACTAGGRTSRFQGQQLLSSSIRPWSQGSNAQERGPAQLSAGQPSGHSVLLAQVCAAVVPSA